MKNSKTVFSYYLKNGKLYFKVKAYTLFEADAALEVAKGKLSKLPELRMKCRTAAA